MNSDPQAERQRRAIQRDWLRQEKDPFTQEEWDAAKTAGLRILQRERYPTARITDSKATVNADTSLAELSVTYDAGRPYRFGALKLEGVERYDVAGIRNIARIPVGRVYREEDLLDAQQRLVSSGYFDSAFLLLDSSERNPDEATVIAQLREAKLQKIVFGLGFSTDTGPRLSVDHTHNKMWPLDWRAQNQAEVGTNTQSLSTYWTDMPKASGWAWNTGLKLARSDYGDIKANSLSLTGGRSRTADRTEHRYFLQYDASNAESSDAPSASSSLMGTYAWTGRYFNDRVNPTRGLGVAAEGGLGVTVTPERQPFLRLNVRALELWPFGGRNTAGKRSRLAVRGEIGAILADRDTDIPANLLFLTGGDTTVRGYSYQSIGTRLADGSTYGARYMAMGSLEWQHPITVLGDAHSFEHTLFVDAGAAADRVGDAVIFPGVGTGVRWSSPVGPLQIDVGYGTKTDRWRIHLRVGFQF
jgi:translocation and assembly module TamA